MTDTVHPAAARGYASTADLYDRARPGYREDAVGAIVERLDSGRDGPCSSSGPAPAS